MLESEENEDDTWWDIINSSSCVGSLLDSSLKLSIFLWVGVYPMRLHFYSMMFSLFSISNTFYLSFVRDFWRTTLLYISSMNSICFLCFSGSSYKWSMFDFFWFDLSFGLLYSDFFSLTLSFFVFLFSIIFALYFSYCWLWLLLKVETCFSLKGDL